MQLLIATSTYFFADIQLKQNLKHVLGTRVWAFKLVYWSPKQTEYVTGGSEVEAKKQ